MTQGPSTGREPYSYRPGGTPKPGGQLSYSVPLYSVQLRHSYYRNGLCPDFQFMPDAASAQLMAQLGMNFRNEQNGFAVYINVKKIPLLYKYIARQVAQDARAWCWLSFLMVQVNPLFVGLTALPITATPANQAMWFCNTQAHARGEQTLLPPGKTVDASALYSLTGAQLVVDVPSGIKPEVKYISGQTALCTPSDTAPEPLVIPRFYAQPAKRMMMAMAAPPPAAITDRYRFDLGALPHDLYTLTIKGHQSIPGFPRSYAYVPPAQDVFGIIDLLLVKPARVKAGVYPVQGSDPADGIVNITYTLPFDARETFWRYYVACQQQGESLTPETSIELVAAGPARGLSFSKSSAVLPSGAPATLFTASAALPLQQSSPITLRLAGGREGQDGHTNPLRIARLPVAPAAPVWPAEDHVRNPLGGTSEIYVYV